MTIWLDRFAIWIAIIAVLIGSARIVSTYPVFSHTADEPGHIACGMHYLYGDPCPEEYAPLPRGMMAVGPKLTGATLQQAESVPLEGLAILNEHYDLYLALARLGILPFFWLACIVIFAWASRDFGNAAAAVAVVLFSLLPPILAHSGMATTDMALTACLGAAFLCSLRWAERPSVVNAILCGVSLGLAVLSKFAALGFLPPALLLAFVWFVIVKRPGLQDLLNVVRQRLLPLGLALLVAGLVVWAGFRFSFGPVFALPFRVPAPEFFRALKFVLHSNEIGQTAYLFGEISDTGFWYYYPVVLAVKTPLAFLLLALEGVVLVWRRRVDVRFAFPLLFALAMLLVGLFSQINIGVRHILPIYMGLSIVAANAAADLMRRGSKTQFAVYVLMAWLAFTGAVKHPDYLAYTNELVQGPPENILVDSDLDWGQDLKRLSQRLRELGAHEVAFNLFFAADLKRQGFPTVKSIDPLKQSPGWTAVSPTWWRLSRFEIALATGRWKFWLDDAKPVERVGTISLYYK